MPQQSRDDGGQFARKYDPDDLLGIMDPLEPYTTGELADCLDWPQRTTFNALDALAEEGLIRKKKPDPRRAIWIRSPEAEATT